MNRLPDRIRVSTKAHSHAQAVLQKFPEFGSIGIVYRVAAILSLRRNGFLEARPEDIDSDTAHPVRLPGVIEMSSNATPTLLFPTIVQIVAGRQIDLEEVYEQVWYHIHLGSSIVGDLAIQATDFNDFYTALMEEIPPGLEANDRLMRSSTERGGGIELDLGVDEKGDSSFWPLTDTSIVENPHACIIGLSGQGKTQFALDLLYQLRAQSPDLSFTVLGNL